MGEGRAIRRPHYPTVLPDRASGGRLVGGGTGFTCESTGPRGRHVLPLAWWAREKVCAIARSAAFLLDVVVVVVVVV